MDKIQEAEHQTRCGDRTHARTQKRPPDITKRGEADDCAQHSESEYAQHDDVIDHLLVIDRCAIETRAIAIPVPAETPFG